MKYKIILIIVLLSLPLTLNATLSGVEPTIPESTNGTWEITKITENAYSSDWNASLALDSANKAHVSYAEKAPAPTVYYLKHASQPFNPAYADETVVSGGYVGLPSSIAIDKSGNGHIAYGAKDNVRYAKEEAGQWQYETVHFSFDWFQDVSLALDSSDNPHISYFDWDTKDVWYSYYDPGTENWKREVVAGDGIFVAQMAWNNGPHLVYKDDAGIQYKHKSGSE